MKTAREFLDRSLNAKMEQDLIEFGGQKSDLVDPYKVGQDVKVSINLGGREWTNPQGEVKYFNSIQGWRIEKLSDANNIEVHDATHVITDLDTDPLPF